MKSIILAILTFSGLAVAAAPAPKRVDLKYSSVVVLSDLKDSSISLDIHYPGMGDRIDTICNIEIRADYLSAPLADLLKAVKIEGLFGGGTRNVVVRGTNTLEIELIPQTYVDGVNLQTNDGSSLKETIQNVLGQAGNTPRVVALAKGCK